jgi:tetratricopeptide (TPR) repeat protein
VGDFGIAAPWNDPDATAMPTAFGPVGTPSYMAPEQVAGDRARIGPAADVYGLGAVFYHVLTGHPPFTTSSVAEMFEQVQSHEPVPPRRLDPAVPRDLETICQKCLRKDERRRYASAQALADDLRRWLDGRPIAARPVSPLERTWVSCRRRPAIAALAFSLALALCAGFVGMLVLWNQAEAQRLRAELDSKVLGDVLSLIVGINAEGNYFPRVADHDRLIANLQMTRKSLLEVAPRRSAQALIDRHLALVDMRLGNALVFEGRWEEARGSLAESVLAWERVVHAHPLDLEARANLAMTLRSAAQVAERQERDNDSEAMLRHALAVAAELMNLTVDAGSICVLADSRYNLAQFLARRGNGDAASALHAANRRMLLESTVESENPDVMAWRVFLIDGFDRVTSVSSPASTGIAPVDGRGSLASPGALELDRLSAERWAETVSEHLHSAARAGSPPSLLADAGFRLTSHFCAIAAEQRHAQKLDGARRTTERIVAFANGLVGRYPDQAFAHLALGEAFAQLQKNASQIGDRPVVERNLKLALDAALDALALDPKNEMARFIADKRRRRLRDLMAGR